MLKTPEGAPDGPASTVIVTTLAAGPAMVLPPELLPPELLLPELLLPELLLPELLLPELLPLELLLDKWPLPLPPPHAASRNNWVIAKMKILRTGSLVT